MKIAKLTQAAKGIQFINTEKQLVSCFSVEKLNKLASQNVYLIELEKIDHYGTDYIAAYLLRLSYKDSTSKNYLIKLGYSTDNGLDSPRDWCNLGNLYLSERGTLRNYDIDYHNSDKYNNELEFFYSLAYDYLPKNKKIDIEETPNYDHLDYDQLVSYWLNKAEKHYLIMPVYKYDHSGVAFSTRPFSCPWDSGQVGYIIADKNKIRKEYKVKRVSKKLVSKVEKILTSEIETFSKWANGECCFYDVYTVQNLDKLLGTGNELTLDYLLENAVTDHLDMLHGIYSDNEKDILRDYVLDSI